ncbi:MAG: hypothetical protein GDA36_01380, partial [Rhodobacteraceae bacterium]|nr:hypothetical protein [Paracoccaceae bacterium]
MFADAQARVGMRRDRASGLYDPLVRFNYLLIGQWYPKAGACTETAVGFHAVLQPRPLMHLYPMRRPPRRFRNALVQGGVHDDLLAG